VNKEAGVTQLTDFLGQQFYSLRGVAEYNGLRNFQLIK
jgi:hypothetical protein